MKNNEGTTKSKEIKTTKIEEQQRNKSKTRTCWSICIDTVRIKNTKFLSKESSFSLNATVFRNTNRKWMAVLMCICGFC